MRGALLILAARLRLDLQKEQDAARAQAHLEALEASGLVDLARLQQIDHDARAAELLAQLGPVVAAQRLRCGKSTLYRAAERHRARLKGAS